MWGRLPTKHGASEVRSRSGKSLAPARGSDRNLAGSDRILAGSDRSGDRKGAVPPLPLVTAILEDYASRGVFRSFSAGPSQNGKALFRMVWHHDRRLELLVDARKKTLCFAQLLPSVPTQSAMHRDLRAFIASRHSGDLPAHRRVDAAKTRLRIVSRGGNISLTASVIDGDFEYAVPKLIHTVHEIFLTFLVDGPYYEYMVEHLGLEQDRY